MKILITGATGLIGKEVGKLLVEKNHELYVLTRNREKALEQLPFPAQIIEGDLDKGPLKDPKLQSIEAVIHLAGESVAGGRWTEERKKQIHDSRTRGTENLRASLPSNLKVIVSASGVGFYGDRGNQELTEQMPPGNDFLAKVCVDWEKAVEAFPGRQVLLRTGTVLSPQGGALEKMMFPFRAGVGGAIGNGQQWMSWIHLQDLARMYVEALENDKYQGVYNAVSPEAVTNREFSRCLAKALGRPLGLSVPKFVLKIGFGEFAEVVTISQKVSSAKIQGEGFSFLYPHLVKALTEICAPYRAGEEVFYAEQFMPAKPEQIFPFFSEAQNLESLTPPLLKFQVQSVSTAKIQEGTLIEYKLKVHGVPMKWLTEIQDWAPPHRFVDTQLKGPYQLWHHTHEFKAFAGGTLMIDRVRYRLPVGYLGWLAAGAFVRKDVEQIFLFRRRFIRENMKTLVSSFV